MYHVPVFRILAAQFTIDRIKGAFGLA